MRFAVERQNLVAYLVGFAGMQARSCIMLRRSLRASSQTLSRRMTRSIPRSSHRPGVEVDAEAPVFHFHLLLVRRWAGLVGQVIFS